MSNQWKFSSCSLERLKSVERHRELVVQKQASLDGTNAMFQESLRLFERLQQLKLGSQKSRSCLLLPPLKGLLFSFCFSYIIEYITVNKSPAGMDYINVGLACCYLDALVQRVPRWLTQRYPKGCSCFLEYEQQHTTFNANILACTDRLEIQVH